LSLALATCASVPSARATPDDAGSTKTLGKLEVTGFRAEELDSVKQTRSLQETPRLATVLRRRSSRRKTTLR
jgi:hypothetical protein